ncbi:MAG: hexokinase [Spirochaetaceae bacterium]|jgi:hexokinase|nr:hexokinase [Spirochaetaceae bacterium]
MSRYNPQELSDFAFYYGFHYAICKLDVLIKDFRLDMERGLRGEKSFMPMLPTYLSPAARVPAGKKVLALDAGGTNLRAALARFDAAGKATVEHVEKAPMPGTRGPIGKEAFFDEIAALAAPILEGNPGGIGGIDGIGFCFSYPMEMTAEGDGILLAFSKEVDAPEVIGQAIGKGLREALFRRGVRYSGRIVLLNDTASTLLCGLASIPAAADIDVGIGGDDKWGVSGAPVIGFILGTGFNTAYPEICIPKIQFNSPDAPQIVVAESGNFYFRYRGRLDIEYDATTKTPSGYTTEKASAGAYLGPLSVHILKQAVRDGVLKFQKQDEFLSWPTLETKDLNAFMRFPLAKEGKIAALFGDDDLDALSSLIYLVSIITRRGGLVSAAVLAGTARHITERTFPRPFTPVRIAVEGTTFLIYKGMRQALESYLYTMLSGDNPVPYVITPVESASLSGAAVAALCKN